MSTHQLKVWPEYFDALWDGRKSFEFRDNDRGFEVGDLLDLRGWDPKAADYTGDMLLRRVTFLLQGPAFGLPEGKVILSLGTP